MIRRAAIVTLCYVLGAAGIGLLFSIVEIATGKPMDQRDVVTAAFWVLCAAAWVWSFSEVMRPQRGGR